MAFNYINKLFRRFGIFIIGGSYKWIQTWAAQFAKNWDGSRSLDFINRQHFFICCLFSSGETKPGCAFGAIIAVVIWSTLLLSASLEYLPAAVGS